MSYLTKENIKLMDALQEMYPDSSKSSLREILKHSRVKIDGSVEVKANTSLEAGQEVSVMDKQKKIPAGVEIIYEDRYIVVVNKPIRLLSVPLDTGLAPSLLMILREYYKTVGIHAVHRIDKATSGIMIFARGKQSQDKLNKMFKDHDLKRGYLAVVQGTLSEDSGIWESLLLEIDNCNVRSDNAQGKRAVTHYSVFHRSKNFSFVKLLLETGRKHQIRVHCKDAGHPIVGDKRYGDKKCNPISRMCLHAHILEFLHPITGKKMSFTAPIPRTFAKLGLKE